jgi:hypothetical protein
MAWWRRFFWWLLGRRRVARFRLTVRQQCRRQGAQNGMNKFAGLSAQGTAGKTGTVTITATADGVTESVAITVTSGQAVSFTLTVSLVSPAPPAPPAA